MENTTNIKNTGIKSLLVKTLKICIGLFITGIGTAMMYMVNWGSAPAATIGDGVHVAFHLSYGVAGILVNIFFLVVLVFLDRKLISIGTILATFFMGIFIDVGVFLIQPFQYTSCPNSRICISFNSWTICKASPASLKIRYACVLVIGIYLSSFPETK